MIRPVVRFAPSYCPASIAKWRSDRTGLQLVLVSHERPTVQGFFAVATECPDDSGAPHTLEHLIFMGSTHYPFKGLLDTLGNRAFSFTNAWTDTDSTVYTLSTAGWQGFRSLLPVYLDHVLNPTLTDEACYTEVYHVDGKGNEKGVVFSEMQAIENEADEIARLAARKILYPADSGYSSETGGLMGALRVLTNDQIREFHKQMYRPDNLCLIIIGTVDETELLDTVAELDKTLPSLPSTPNPRPFVDSIAVPALSETVVSEVVFPDKDESAGSVWLFFQGPAATDILKCTLVTLLTTYLTDGDVSLLRKALVEIETPLCNDVEVSTENFIREDFALLFRNVPMSEHASFVDKVFAILRQHIDNDEFDMARMADVIQRERLQYQLNAERDPSTFASAIIADFQYAPLDGTNLEAALGSFADYDAAAAFTKADWVALLRNVLVAAPYIAVLAKPSAELAKKIHQDAKKRLRKTRHDLGKEGLEKLSKRLKMANDANEQKIPDDLISQFPAPDPAKVKFINTVSAVAGFANGGDVQESEAQALIDADAAGAVVPLYLHFEHVQSNFVGININLSTSVVPVESLPLLLVILEGFFAVPLVLSDGTEIDFETVVRDLQQDTITTSNVIGFHGEFHETVTFELQITPDKYTKAIEWFAKLMWKSKFDKQRLQIVLEKLIMALPERKRAASMVAKSAMNRILYTKRSVKRAIDLLESEVFLLELAQDLKTDPESVIARFEEFRKTFFRPDNMRVFVCADVKQLAAPVQSWIPFLAKAPTPATAAPPTIPRTISNHSAEGSSLGGNAYILPVAATESCYATMITHGPADFTSADLFPLAVVSAYLEAVEGPFWRGIRGSGLAYGAHMTRSTEDGTLAFSLYRAADAVIGIQRAREIVTGYAAGTTPFEPLLVASAVSSIVCELAEAGSDAYAAASRKFAHEVLRGLGARAQERFLAGVRDVTPAHMQEVTQRLLMPVFSAESASLFVACNPSKIEVLSGGFEKFGYAVVVDPFHSLDKAGGEEAAESDDGEESEDNEDDDSDEDDEDESGSSMDEDESEGDDSSDKEK
ncbi:Metalloenzyme, LuxS/M16 peptidase-like protein [Limtongia smithiae]|uniref:Metalloenzyme, LuxS/M16 peptidase-like protein n=1 Tax=Limtongia smithiae TaxID=1125753 RepID=UPI0034CEBBF6